MLLQDRVVVITGAGSGIGRVLTQAFSREGASIAIVGRRLEALQETARGCLDSRKVLCVQGNISVAEDVTKLQAAVCDAYLRCDILVNNAGIFKPEPGTPLHEASLEDWDEVMNTNVRGAWLCLRAFAPLMIEQNYGRIINLTSGLKHAAGHGIYSISKSALDSLTKTAAQELAAHDILVNALNPGWVRTEMASNAPNSPDQVVPLALRLATLPKGETSGVEFHV
jgi:3-oxoacyl-[acyl-carrier protein] reductase